MRNIESSRSLAHGAIQATINLLGDRINLLNNTIHEKKGNDIAIFYHIYTNIIENIRMLEVTINDFEKEQKEITQQCLIFDQLISVFGPKGIQNYVFLEVIKQLEDISNSYLNVLAEGGIQLTLLESNDKVNTSNENSDGDRILKAVLIRGNDGKFKDRGT